MSQQSAFKQLYSEIIKNGGDFSKFFQDKQSKKQIKCFVKESFPHFLVTDGFFFVPCYFTRKAIDDFKAKFTNINITDLKKQVIVITSWDLEINKVNSADVFTSYGGIEVKLIVKGFKHHALEKDQITLTRYPLNLYRDDEMKTLIQNYTHQCLTGAVKSSAKNDSLPDISKFSASKQNTNQGIISFASGNTFNQYGFKEGKTQTVDMVTIFKQEKGVNALKKLQQTASTGKAKVTGGATLKKRSRNVSTGKSGGVKRLTEQISKFTHRAITHGL